MIQNATPLFHHLQYSSRTGRSAIDSLMLTVSQGEPAIHKGLQVSLLGRDIVSVYNQVKRQVAYLILMYYDMQPIAEFVQNFVKLRQFKVQWHIVERGTDTMTNGTQQSSSLSPVL